MHDGEANYLATLPLVKAHFSVTHTLCDWTFDKGTTKVLSCVCFQL